MGWFISRTHRWNNSVSLKEVWRAKWISFAPLSKDIKKNAVWALSEDNLSLVSFWLHKQRLPFKKLKIKRIQWMVLFPSIPLIGLKASHRMSIRPSYSRWIAVKSRFYSDFFFIPLLLFDRLSLCFDSHHSVIFRHNYCYNCRPVLKSVVVTGWWLPV